MNNPSKIDPEAMQLLRHIVTVGEWVKSADPRAKPYIDANAVRLINGTPEFHKDRFLEVLAKERRTDA